MEYISGDLSFTFLNSKFLEHDLLDPRGRERGVEGMCRPSEGRAVALELELVQAILFVGDVVHTGGGGR
jgi:hypothetical protein